MTEEETLRRLDELEEEMKNKEVELNEFIREMEVEIEKQEKKQRGNKKPLPPRSVA